MMNDDYASGLENPFYSELKYFCKKIQEAYSELKEDLTPFRDDRFYRLAPMRLYSLSKRHFVLVFVVFLVCFALTVFIGVAGPKILYEQEHNAEQLIVKNVSIKTGPFNIGSPPLNTYNQQLWLTCVMQVEHSNIEGFQQPFEINVELKGVVHDATEVQINKIRQKSRRLHCVTKCDEIIVLHLGYLNYTQYRVRVSFKGLENVTYDISVKFVWKMYNPTFSQVEIWFRFVFVVLTFMVTCMFAHSLRKFSMRDWGIEQKWMSVLLPLLLLYNDPFFPLSFLVNSWFPGTLDAFFQALFLSALLLFWLCVYHGIRVQGERKCLTFYLPKLIIVGLLWLSAVTLGIWQTVNELQDPTYQYKVDIGNFQGMKVFFLVIVVLYILYLIFLVVRACSELKNMPYSDLRLRFLTALTFVVLVISMVILYLRFGAKALQNNFVAELSTHYQNSAEFLSFYGLLNFYLYTLAFVYSPSKNSLYDIQLKDNPAFSMLNDSDDEVIYRSDYEDMPLQNGRAIKATAKYQDESDSE
ncbi:transmembrane protein 181 isoform X1 [Takifugu flavidus]|uniref:transmembrane protein 181 isoform X1 n=1 Tax=Takifugu flavidus TaxID=433684 RepID=UPI0025442DA4|nr:transmembrane protein 181 isoform X1 [Takifugu flavidus]